MRRLGEAGERRRLAMLAQPPRGPRESPFAYDVRMPRYVSRKPAQYAIELKAGSIRRLKLYEVRKIELDFPRLRSMATH